MKKCTKCDGTIILTTYNTLQLHRMLFFKIDWDYCILDEGHKIKNPDIDITLLLKQVKDCLIIEFYLIKIKTCHRIILSGTPIQNNLKELWSLIDFVCPKLLGTLPSFMEHIAQPIALGGYANATKLQVMTCYKTAKILQNIIEPYILRRTKVQVDQAIHLPPKKERILFCKLTDYQMQLYKEYLKSDQVLNAQNQYMTTGNKTKNTLLQALGQLRKLCNHPDLMEKIRNEAIKSNLNETQQFDGNYKNSGKMIVLEALLKRWQILEHRVLLFSQSRKVFI